MKYVQVTPEGEVIGLENKQAIKYAYGSMLFLRVALPFNFSLGHMIYPARQLFFLYEKMGKQYQAEYKKEIINYTATGIGYILANRYSQKLFQAFSAELNAKNFEKADKALVKSHIISATFKALASWKALKISTEIATRNKYAVFRTTGLPYSYNNIVPSVTYQGDNSVLLQQTARFILMKDKGEDLSKPNLKVKDDDLSSVINMLRYVSSMEIRRLKKTFQVQFEAGTGMKNMWNEKYQRDIIEVSKLWGTLQLLQGFADTLKETEDLRTYFTKVGKVFTKNLLVDVPQIYTYGFEIL